MASEKLRAAIVGLLASGQFSDTTIVLDSETISNPAPASANPDTFNENGWSFNNASAVGGIKSRGVEALRHELLAANYGAMASPDFLPEFHVVEFWRNRDEVEGFAVRDPSRYEVPDEAKNVGLDADQLRELIDNVTALTNSEFATQIVGGHVSTMYRGEAGKSPPEFKLTPTGGVDFSPAPPPGYAPATLVTPRQPGNVAHFFTHTDAGGVDHVKVTPGSEIPASHYIYDPWWNGKTDADVTRYWRAVCISNGAKIPLDPA